MTEDKIIVYDRIFEVRFKAWDLGHTLAITNGCFDILHAGHVDFLERVKAQVGMLMVGVNSDRAVRELKGDTRPVNSLENRMRVLAALACVDVVVPLDCVRVDGFIRDVAATRWYKGGDYTLDTLDKGEVAAAKETLTEIRILPMVAGISTTAILAKASK